MKKIRAQIYYLYGGAFCRHSIQRIDRASCSAINLTEGFRAVPLTAYDPYGHLLPRSILPERFEAAVAQYRRNMRKSARAAGKGRKKYPA